MTTHSSTYKGKRVYIVLKDGASFVDKFVDTKSGYVYTQEKGKLRKADIRTMTIYRNQAG
ncbi:MAG: hypothetical protein WC860_08745 [Candidatus Margulisiibacteriota bacterium]|jgi:hypothetical protein